MVGTTQAGLPDGDCCSTAAVAELPNECWQSGFTHCRLAGGADAEILTWLDNHCRYALPVTAYQPVTGPAVLAAFRSAVAAHGIPASTLTDGMVFTTRFAGGRGGRNALEAGLRLLGVRQKNGKPNRRPRAKSKDSSRPEEMARRPAGPAR